MQADPVDLEWAQAEGGEEGSLRLQNVRDSSDPGTAVHRAVMALCKVAGHTLVRLRSSAPQSMRKVSAAAADRRTCCWRVSTDGGTHHAFFYPEPGLFGSKFRAALWLKDAPHAAAVVVLSRVDYEEILSGSCCAPAVMH